MLVTEFPHDTNETRRTIQQSDETLDFYVGKYPVRILIEYKMRVLIFFTTSVSNISF